jgi:hypothetical protein
MKKPRSYLDNMTVVVDNVIRDFAAPLDNPKELLKLQSLEFRVDIFGL